MAARDSGDMSDNTIRDYLNDLRRIFVVEELPAWSPAFKSKSAAMFFCYTIPMRKHILHICPALGAVMSARAGGVALECARLHSRRCGGDEPATLFKRKQT